MAAKDPLLSIFMPTHNQAEVLPVAIKGVLAQSFQDFEILLVGDGCTDNTSEVVKSFSDPRIKWFDLPKVPNSGYANRNIALKEARGRFIGFASHDDILLYDHFEKCIDALESDSDLEIVFTRSMEISSDGIIVPGEFNLEIPGILNDFLGLKYSNVPESCAVHRKNCFNIYGYWNDELSKWADWDLWIRIIEGGNRNNFRNIPDVTVLSFISERKNDIKEGFRDLEHWITLYKNRKEIPEVLFMDIPENTPEQLVVWDIISRDPIRWTSDIRKANRTVYDMMIYHARQLISDDYHIRERKKTGSVNTGDVNSKNKVLSLEHKIEDLRSIVEIKNRKIERINKKISGLYQSFSWKIGRGITKSILLLLGWIPGLINGIVKILRLLFGIKTPGRASPPGQKSSRFQNRQAVLSWFNSKKGLEIGGPSPLFNKNGVFPIYELVDQLDGCNFSTNTIWEGQLTPGGKYQYTDGKWGYQYVLEGADLNLIENSKYDFVLGSHCLEHMANPIKAIEEWLRVLKKDGLIFLVLPNKDHCFDHKRSVTYFNHLLEDYKINTGEDDLTHLNEILELHDLEMDKPAGTKDQFRERSLKNFENRTLHHHVFDLDLLKEIFEWFKIQVVYGTSSNEHRIIGRKTENN